MCVAVPRRVLEVLGDRLLVELDHDASTWVRAAGLTDVRHGEYVLVYAGHAVDRISQADAEDLLAFYASLEMTP